MLWLSSAWSVSFGRSATDQTALTRHQDPRHCAERQISNWLSGDEGRVVIFANPSASSAADRTEPKMISIAAEPTTTVMASSISKKTLPMNHILESRATPLI